MEIQNPGIAAPSPGIGTGPRGPPGTLRVPSSSGPSGQNTGKFTHTHTNRFGFAPKRSTKESSSLARRALARGLGGGLGGAPQHLKTPQPLVPLQLRGEQGQDPAQWTPGFTHAPKRIWCPGKFDLFLGPDTFQTFFPFKNINI